MTTLPGRIQKALASFYGIELGPPVDAFIRPDPEGREALVVRDEGGYLEIALYLPASREDEPSFDELCQIIEGVSHFLCVAERARRELPVSELELELQAEVDKYVLLAHEPGNFDARRSAELRSELYDRVRFLDPEGSERGERYRLANVLAARFAARLETSFARRGRHLEMQSTLRKFHAVGLTDKLTLALAA